MTRPLIHFVRWCFGVDSPTTQTTDAERELLVSVSKGRKRLVEIGVWEGVTARQIRKSMDADAVYFAVDPYRAGRLGFSIHRVIAHHTVESVRNGTVHWLRETGAVASQNSEVKKSLIDFLFVDGDHSYEGLKADWEAWSGLIAPGGVVGLHDSRSTTGRLIDTAGSVRFTNDVILNDARFEVTHEVDSLTVLCRRDAWKK